MNTFSSSIRLQVISVTVLSLLVLAIVLVTIDISKQHAVLVDTERRVGLTLIRSVSNTIDSVRPYIETLGDIEELDTRLAELVQRNDNITFIAVTDADGKVIAHSDLEDRNWTSDQLAHLPINETILREIPGFGEVYLTTLSFESDGLVETPSYQIIVASAAQPIRDRQFDHILSSVLVTALFTLGAAGFIIMLLQHYFVRPVERLTLAMEAIEEGDFTQQVSTSQSNELGQLASGFNRMTRQLGNLINELEDRVKERTLALEGARDQAEQASRAKSDFLSNMSHELRTPLNIVIGYASSMLTMPQMYNNITIPEIYRKDVELIRDSGKHLLALINDILDLSKVEAGKLRLNFASVELSSIFDSAIAISVGLVGDKPIQVRQNYPDNLPKVWADNIRVRQILLNLLSNAIKYTNTGHVTLFAEVRGDEVYVAIRDTGPGIPESALGSIFDRFEQIQNSAEIQGTGLGLDISQKLAQLHGSEITIETAVGNGSTFAFCLPIATVEQHSHEPKDTINTINTEVFNQNIDLQTLSLIIGPDLAIRQNLRRTLEAQHIVVVEASESAYGIDLAIGLLPDIIWLDANMPESDIHKILNTINNDAETRNIPIVTVKNGTDGSFIDPRLVKSVLQGPISPEKVTGIIKSLSLRPGG